MTEELPKPPADEGGSDDFTDPRDAEIEQLETAYLQARHRGENPARAEIVARHPQLQPELEARLAAAAAYFEHSQAAQLLGIVLGAAEPEMPRQIDRYLIRGELGRGAFGIVYLADDPALRRAVAINTTAHV